MPVGDLTGAVIGGWNYVSNNSNTADNFGHGTRVEFRNIRVKEL